MFDRLFQLIKIARKLGSSGALETINEVYKIPFILKIFLILLILDQRKKFMKLTKHLVKNFVMLLNKWGLLLLSLDNF